MRLAESRLIPEFVQSLQPYYTSTGQLDAAFAAVKHEELLLMLLRQQPKLAGILFEYGTPGKVDLEAFMTRNYKFNVPLARFAFLTGRSLSAFKRDFQALFHQSPSRWLVQQRLQEAYFLLQTQGRHPAEIYLELGFEDLSHFSFAFKKRFHCAPTALVAGVARNQGL